MTHAEYVQNYRKQKEKQRRYENRWKRWMCGFSFVVPRGYESQWMLIDKIAKYYILKKIRVPGFGYNTPYFEKSNVAYIEKFS